MTQDAILQSAKNYYDAGLPLESFYMPLSSW